jgi:hypothetical protein
VLLGRPELRAAWGLDAEPGAKTRARPGPKTPWTLHVSRWLTRVALGKEPRYVLSDHSSAAQLAKGAIQYARKQGVLDVPCDERVARFIAGELKAIRR